MYSKLIVKGYDSGWSPLILRNGCKVAILLLKYIYSHSCTACAGPCMQVSKCLEKTSMGFRCSLLPSLGLLQITPE